MKGMRRKNTDEHRRNEREKIQSDVDKYLAAGNKIDEIPSGVSGESPLGLSEVQRTTMKNCK